MRKPPPLPEQFACRRDEAGELVEKPVSAMTDQEVQAAVQFANAVAYRLSLASSHEPDDQALTLRALEAEQRLGRLLIAMHWRRQRQRRENARPGRG